MKKILSLACFIGFACALFISVNAYARTEGFYIGGGYQQPLLWSWKKQGDFTQQQPGSAIRFWPTFGAYAVGGYEFGYPDWLGLALPVNWSYMKLNRSEWVQHINADAEAIFHLSDPENKFDPFLGALIGFNFLTEGKVQNESQSIGPDFGFTMGFRYSLMEYAVAGSPHIKNLSLVVELPVKIILWLNDHDLSNSGTTPFLQFPLHVGLTYTF